MEKSNETRIVTNFNTQHPDVRKIIQTLASFEGGFTHFKFCCQRTTNHLQTTRSLKDRLVHSHHQTNPKLDLCRTFGTFPCSDCEFCKYIDNRISMQNINGYALEPRHCANCKAKGIIYLMMCKCQSFYVGKTKRELRVRMSKHIRSIRIGDQLYPVSHNTSRHNGYDLSIVKFIVLDRVHPDPRGGDWDKRILQLESRCRLPYPLV